jgi:pimeloyl-ACP methyl ester carboxylesterase
MSLSATIGTPHSAISSDGTPIRYYTVGVGEGVIVVPGVLSTADDYVVLGAALSKHFAVHTVERRGRGDSGSMGPDYSIASERADIAAIQSATGARCIFGHSYGGLIALNSAEGNKNFARVAVYEPGVSVGGCISSAWMKPAAHRIRFLAASVSQLAADRTILVQS